MWFGEKIPPAANNNNFKSVAINREIVTFHSDDKVVTKKIPREKSIPAALKRGIQEDREHSIKNFLHRPLRIEDGVWSSTSAAGHVLTSFELPKDVFSNSLYQQKLQGFLGFRAGATIRVQLNAQRFQQGRLLLVYIPQGQINQWRTALSLQSLTLMTQLPRVEIDCSTNTAAELSVPYMSTTTHYNLLDYTGPLGKFYLVVYSPLISASATSVNYTVWINFDNVELEFPTVTFTPQSFVYDRVVPQGPEEDKDGDHRGLISKPLKIAADFANNIGEAVPVLSAYTTPIRWVLDIGSKIAAIFGWSKPTDNDKAVKRTIDVFSYSQNIDAVDQSKKVSLFSTNQVDVCPGFAGTDTDEMDIGYVCSIPAFIESFTWNASDSVDTQVFSMNVSLPTFTNTRTVAKASGNLAVLDPIPATYVANCFRYWRGSITFTFKFIKTEFHSGRLMFYFAPGTSTSPSSSDIEYLYKETVDIRESNEYTVTVPYVKTTPYAQFSDIIGVVFLNVLNPLVAPATVNQYINVLLEVSAGPDFEVAVPNDPQYQMMYQVPTTNPQGFDYKIVPQALDVDEAVDNQETQKNLESDPIASSDLNSGFLSPARNCIGERIFSLRALLKRYCRWFELDVNAITADGVNHLWICPTDITPNIFVTGSDPTTYSVYTSLTNSNCNFSMDYYTYFGSMYQYFRGSTRLKMYKASNSVVVGTVSADDNFRAILRSRNTQNAPVVDSGDGPYPRTYFAYPTLHVESVNGGLEVEIPQYMQTVSSMNLIMGGSSHNPTTYPLYVNQNLLGVNYTTSNSRLYITRAIGDDFSFGMFLGALPLVLNASFPDGNWPDITF